MVRRSLSLVLLCLLLAIGATHLAAPQSSAVASVYGGTCEGDLDGDGFVFVRDLLILLGDWGCTGECVGDVNGDGAVTVDDLLALLTNFGPCDGPACESHADCDDGDPCTIDLCILGVCHNIDNPECD